MTIRVRHIAEVNPAVPEWDRLRNDDALTFVPLEAVWPRRVDFSQSRRKVEVATGYTRFIEGDVVVPKITPTFEADRSTWISGMPTRIGAGTTELHIVRARHAEPRYLDYLFSSRPFLQGGAAQMIGVAGQKRVPDSWIRDFPVPITDLPTQRAIADYLDAETARIDALITKKRRMIDLLLERWRSSVDEITGRGDPVQVRYLTSAITSGPRGWADRVSAKGAPFIRSANLRRDSVNLQLEDLARLTPPVTAESQRSMTSVGDTLVGITGANTGWVGWVNDETSGGYVSQHVAMLRPKDVEPHWLTYSLFAHRSQDQLLGGQYGGTKTQLGLSDLAELKIRLPTAREQRALLDQLDQERKRVNQTRKALPTQLDLLIERRQALITAAVTGELEIPGVAA